MRQALFILLFLPGTMLQAQMLDSIEYNVYVPLYNFKLDDYTYTFYNDSGVIESDSLLFKTSVFLGNYRHRFFAVDMEDSVRLAVLSRTLKKYGEKALYHSKKKFDRIICLQPQKAVIMKFYDDSLLVCDVGNGGDIFKGKIVKEIVLDKKNKLYKKLIKKLQKIREMQLKDGVALSISETPYWTLIIYERFNGINYKLYLIEKGSIIRQPIKRFIKIEYKMEKFLFKKYPFVNKAG